jgi:heme/copper-type cytochrome/quinol oxidase subunit 2
VAHVASVLLLGAEKGGAEENWPGPLIAVLVVAIVLAVAGVVCMFFIGKRERPAG